MMEFSRNVLCKLLFLISFTVTDLAYTTRFSMSRPIQSTSSQTTSDGLLVNLKQQYVPKSEKRHGEKLFLTPQRVTIEDNKYQKRSQKDDRHNAQGQLTDPNLI